MTLFPLAVQATGGMSIETANKRDAEGASTSTNEPVMKQIVWGNTLNCLEYKRKWNSGITQTK